MVKGLRKAPQGKACHVPARGGRSRSYSCSWDCGPTGLGRTEARPYTLGYQVDHKLTAFSELGLRVINWPFIMMIVLGRLAGSFGRASDSWSQGCEFEPCLRVEFTGGKKK